MKKLTSVLGALIAMCVFASAAIAGDKTINDKCPLSGKGIDASQTSKVKVEFCCDNCKGKFDKAPGKFMAKAAKGEKGKCIFSGDDASASSTLNVGFCCGNCKGKFDKAPAKSLAKVKPKKKDS